jgi:Holliday junction resolvase RusA-like endonuclease
MITFDIPGKPTGKGRPRATVRGRHAAVYTDKKTANAEVSFLAQALPYKPVRPLTGMLAVTICTYEKPASRFNAAQRAKALANAIRPTGKPDADNVAKLCLDALNGVFFEDDCQVVDLIVHRYHDTTPHVRMQIEEIASAPAVASCNPVNDKKGLACPASRSTGRIGGKNGGQAVGR